MKNLRNQNLKSSDGHLSPKLIILLFVGALSARLLAASVLASSHELAATTHHEHASIAENLARGNGFRFNFFGRLDQPVLTSIEAPLVPGMLALSYVVFGIEAPASYHAVLILQLVISALTVVGIGLIADRLGGRRIATVTAGLAIFYPPLIISGLHIQALPWNLFWLTLMLLASHQLLEERTMLGAVNFLTAGVGGLLTDPILAAPLAALLGYLAFSLHEFSVRWRLPAMLSIGILVGISPWLLRNYQVHGRFVFIKDSLPFVFWQGNNAGSMGTDKLLPGDTGNIDWIFDPRAANQQAFALRSQAISVNSILPPAFIAKLQSLPTEIERMDEFRNLAVDALRTHPIGYLTNCVRRAWYLVWFDPTNPRSYLWHYRIGYLALLVLALGGMSKGKVNSPPLWLAAVTLVTVHVLIITSARFRIPLELLLLFPAGHYASGILLPFTEIWERTGLKDPQLSKGA